MRGFLVGLLFLWSVCFAMPLVTAVNGSLQPLDGDLTRIGGLSERDFGWNEPQLRFDRLVTARYRSLDVLARSGLAYDFIVLGDSFSEAGVNNAHKFGYQEWIQTALGLSVATISQAQIDYARLVCDIKNLPAPPRYLVYQTAERYLEARIQRLEAALAVPATCPDRPKKSYVRAVVFQIGMHPFQRPIALEWHSIYATYFSRIDAAVGTMTGYARNSVEKFSLTNSNLFSSIRRRELLVVNEDVGTRPIDARRVRDVVYRLSAMMARESGTTFILLVSPNKLSAYRAYVEGDAPQPLSPMLKDAGVPMPDIDGEISALIGAGYRDVYLPNDTHWGYRGHCAAAHALATFLSVDWHFRSCRD